MTQILGQPCGFYLKALSCRIVLNVWAGFPLQRHVEYDRHQLGVAGRNIANQHHRQNSAPRETQEKAKDEEGDTSVKVTGLTQKLGQLETVHRDFQSKYWANLKFLGQPCNFYARVVLEIYEDAKGTPREQTMQWVVELLFPTLLGWNQWAWERRRCAPGTSGAHARPPTQLHP